jgi:hypothetical protein
MNNKKNDRTPPPPLEERLKFYGLSPDRVHLEDLALGEGESIRVSLRGDSRFAKSAHRIRVNSITDLKRLIGVPDAVVRQQCACRFGADLSETVPPGFKTVNELTPEQIQTLGAAAHEYIHGNSEPVRHYESALNQAISSLKRSAVSLALFQDILVERNATLILDSSVDVIFARHITIKLGGKIRALGSFVKYDCSSVQGEEWPYVTLAGIRATAAHT